MVMKKISFLLTLCLLLFSCSENEADITPTNVEPGTYIVGINLNTETPLSRGVDYDETENEFKFTDTYDYNFIYLHKETGDEAIQIPVYEQIECEDGQTCKGFRYKLSVDEYGNATITPLDNDGNEIEENGTLSLKADEKVYFSSWKTQTWENEKSSSTVPNEESSVLYRRVREKNVELFRNGSAYDDGPVFLSIADLKDSGQLELKRVCSGFSFLCVFTDRTDNEGLTRNEFYNYMGDYPENYYLKIYLGSSFVGTYDISTQTGTEQGFYATGDSYNEDYGNNDYVPLRGEIVSNEHNAGFGYSTLEGNELIAPIDTDEGLTAYIYIIHKGTDGSIDADKALYYTLLIGDVQENYFYRIGADIDIRELAAAFEEYESATTRSASGPRLFTPKSLITTIEY